MYVDLVNTGIYGKGKVMADFGALQQGWSDDLLRQLGQGEFILKHSTAGAADPSKPWLPVPTVIETEKLLGTAKGVSSKMIGVEVGGTVIVATDIEALTSVPQIDYVAGDIMSLDGKDMVILSVKRIPEGGIPAKVKFILR